jgi:hypothetical protein
VRQATQQFAFRLALRARCLRLHPQRSLRGNHEARSCWCGHSPAHKAHGRPGWASGVSKQNQGALHALKCKGGVAVTRHLLTELVQLQTSVYLQLSHCLLPCAVRAIAPPTPQHKQAQNRCNGACQAVSNKSTPTTEPTYRPVHPQPSTTAQRKGTDLCQRF